MALSKQDVFDKVALHLLKQYKRSEVWTVAEDNPTAASSSCMYRHPEGLMCAVGCLIPDELYDESIEGILASNVVACDVRFQELFEPDVLKGSLLSHLQALHDQESVDDWYISLVNCANIYSLNTDVIHKP